VSTPKQDINSGVSPIYKTQQTELERCFIVQTWGGGSLAVQVENELLVDARSAAEVQTGD
jgi:hypothetical protein